MSKDKKPVPPVNVKPVPARPEPYRRKNIAMMQNAGGGGYIPDDDRTIRRTGTPVQMVRPKFKSNGSMVVRFLPQPALDAKGKPLGYLDVGRYGSSAEEVTDWITCVPGAHFVGLDEKQSFLLYDPYEAQEDPSIRNNNPYIVLHRTIDRAVRNGNAPTAKWNKYVTGGQGGQDKSLPRETQFYYAQGLLYENDTRVYVADGKPPKGLTERDLPVVIQLRGSAGQCVSTLARELTPDYAGDTDDFEAMYRYGDMVRLDKGRFVRIFNPDTYSPAASDLEEKVTTDVEDFDMRPESGKERSGNRIEFKGYEAECLDVYTPPRGTLRFKPALTKYEKLITSRVVPWKDLLLIPSQDQLCLYIARAFASDPKLLHFGWADHAEFFTAEVKGVLARRAQVGIPGAPPADTGDDFGDDDDDGDDEPAPAAHRSSIVDSFATDDDDEPTGVDAPADADDDEEEEEETDSEKEGDDFNLDAPEATDEFEEEIEDPEMEKAMKLARERAAARSTGKPKPRR